MSLNRSFCARCAFGVLPLLVLLVGPGSAFAQQSQPAGRAVEVGYSALRDIQDGVRYWDHGLQVEFSQPVHAGSRIFALVGDFSWHHNTFYDDSLKAYLGGVRSAVWTHDRIEPFVQVLAGVEDCCSNHGLTLQPGGGVNLWIADGLGVRVQADFRLARYSHEEQATTYKEARIGVGVVLPLGRR